MTTFHAPTTATAAHDTHPALLAIELGDDDRVDLARLVAAAPRDLTIADEAFTGAAGHAARLLPASLHDALVDFADRSHPSGAMVVRGLPVGDVPATPASPRHQTDKDRISEFVLLAVARRLGQPVGYEPEHGGELVQNLVPTAGALNAQTSTSSAVILEFHTEAAFHPHKPRFLLLLGLRADPFGEARTLLCSIDAVLDSLTPGTRAALAQPRFRTGVDESYLSGSAGTGRPETLGQPVPVLSGDPDRPTLTFDADLMVGVDTEAEDALQELRRAVREHHIGVALGPGDLLVVDNHAAVHGRSPFRARFDGTDRWLQRSFVVSDLAASAGERRGRVITTRFG
jgi:alpha-ketoglutarate-dependent taurine dioxygenase